MIKNCGNSKKLYRYCRTGVGKIKKIVIFGAGEGIQKLHSVLVCHNLQRFLGKVHCKCIVSFYDFLFDIKFCIILIWLTILKNKNQLTNSIILEIIPITV